jgi:nitrous oxidase accessory protein NosD
MNCAATDNTAASGIEVGFGSSLSNCTASFNTSAASSSFGIKCGGGCTVSHCTAFFNASTAATDTASTGCGIFANYRSIISNCTAGENHGDGIQVTYQCRIFGNTCSNAGANNGSGAGIHTTADHNSIEGNNVVTNTRGIEVSSTGSLIIANKSGGNFSSNYVIAADNRYGAIIDIRAAGAAAVNGGTAVASTVASVDPWANFSY